MNELPKGWKGLTKKEIILKSPKSELEKKIDEMCKGTDYIGREADEMRRTCLNKEKSY